MHRLRPKLAEPGVVRSLVRAHQVCAALGVLRTTPRRVIQAILFKTVHNCCMNDCACAG